jgi:hypothetical protein
LGLFSLHLHYNNDILLHLTRDACSPNVSNYMLNNMASTYAVVHLGMATLRGGKLFKCAKSLLTWLIGSAS